ncbi:MAG: DUF58 domain-containing protein [Planctomycetota bacterium]
MSIETNPNRSKKPNVVGKLGQALNYDFCPQFNQYVYWLKKPFGWVICGALISALVGFLIGPQGFVLMWSFIALLLIGAVWPWLGMKGVTCQLRFDDTRACEGETTKAILEVSNRWPIPVFGLTVEGEFLQDIETEEDRIAVGLQRIPGWSVCQFEWDFEPERRGILPAKTPRIANGFPFGIYRSERNINVDQQTIVWPRRQPLEGHPDVDGDQFNVMGLLSDRVGEDGEVIGVRPFRDGDSIRNVHWQKTAATQQVVIKERQKLAQRLMEVVVDLTPSTHGGKGSQNSYEWAIRIAGNICRKLHQSKSQVGIICLGLPNEIESRSNNQWGLEPLLDYLAILPPLDSPQLQSKDRPLAVEYSFNPHAKTILICTNQSSLCNQKKDVVSFVMDSETFVLEQDEPEVNGSGVGNLLALATIREGVDSIWESACEQVN